MSSRLLAPNKVGSAYEDFVQAFCTAAEDANSKVVLPDRPLRSCFTASGDTTAAFNSCLYLKDWPCRKLARIKRLDIVIKALEAFTVGDPWLLTKSTVYLDYFVVANSAASLAQSLHFDFVDGGQADHPFFHVQLGDEGIPHDDLRSAGFDLQLNVPQQSNECWVTTRIPTPDMTLASVLYCLVANHLQTGIFRQFAEKISSIQDRLPHPVFEKLRMSFQESSVHFKSSHWFAHMR